MKPSIARNDRERKRGFSLLEVLVSVAAISSLTSIAVFAIGSATENSKGRKLMADVATLNSAIRVYKANGGKIVGSWKADKILTELKTIANADSAAKLPGLSGSLLDSRIEPVMESVAEAAEGNPKALWDETNQRFYIAHTNERGIKEFQINESLSEEAVQERERTAHLEYAVNDSWIWDYEDFDLPSASPPMTPGNPHGDIGGKGGGSSNRLTLDPPTFSVAGGQHPLPAYDLDVYLSDQNPDHLSDVFYSVEPGVWVAYNGEAITVSPGGSIEAYAASLDPRNWNDSPHVLEVYAAIPMPLVAGLQFSKSEYTYMEAGGAMIPGIYPPQLAPPGTASLLNANELPPRYLNGSSFGLFQILPDESEQQITLDGNFRGPVPLSLADYGTESSATYKVRARSNVNVLHDSETSVTLGIQPMPLREPILEEIAPPGGPPASGGYWVEITPQTDLGDVPVGARIYYTTDGSDPGADHGFPTSPTAQLYSGPFSIEQPPNMPIKARVYAPEGYERWFYVSSPTEIMWAPSPQIGFAMGVSTAPPEL